MTVSEQPHRQHHYSGWQTLRANSLIHGPAHIPYLCFRPVQILSPTQLRYVGAIRSKENREMAKAKPTDIRQALKQQITEKEIEAARLQAKLNNLNYRKPTEDDQNRLYDISPEDMAMNEVADAAYQMADEFEAEGFSENIVTSVRDIAVACDIAAGEVLTAIDEAVSVFKDEMQSDEDEEEAAN